MARYNSVMMIFVIMMMGYVILSGGQSCIDNPDVNQKGTNLIPSGRQVIIPNIRFNCTVRITHIAVSLAFGDLGSNPPMIQIWRPLFPGSTVYSNLGQVRIPSGKFKAFNHLFVNLTISNSDDINFVPGDVIGYYQPLNATRLIWSIETSGYTSYSNNVNSARNRIDISNVDNVETNQQPLIELSFDIRCDDLSTPPNGEITSCSSSRVGVSYEGDTCNFTCNTGYELTGSDTRTCQSNGSWSGSDDVCRKVTCSVLNKPNNGAMDCSLGDDGVASYEDTCNVTCNTGYELTGNPQRTCQSDGSWSGSPVSCTIMECPSSSLPMNSMLTESCSSTYQSMCDLQCEEGFNGSGDPSYVCDVLSDGSSVTWVTSGEGWSCERVQCSTLFNTDNGTINCLLGDDEVPSYEDSCNLTCNTGYELTGSDTRTCQSNGRWSGSDGVCRRVTPVGDDGGGSGSSSGGGAIVGGVVGVVVCIIAVVIVVLVVIFIVKRSQLRKKYPTDNNKDSTKGIQDSENVDAIDNAMYDTVILAPPPKPASECKSLDSPKYEVLEKIFPSMDGIYEMARPYELPVSVFEMSGPSPYAIVDCTSLEVEQLIYDTPFEDEDSYGPIYYEPPLKLNKIYEEFEGKRFRKLYHHEIRNLEQLGAGEFGVVTHAMWKSSIDQETEVAVKTLNIDANDKDKLRFLQEAAIMCQFDHENVIKLYGVVTEAPAMIVLEYMSRGDLKNMLIDLRHLNEATTHMRMPVALLKFCNEIAAGMTYLSGKRFVHRDLAARNILVSDKCTCKIADFGMSRDLLNQNYYLISGGKIPVKWTAPEALHYRRYSIQSDVWSYGCVVYEIWSLGYKPFKSLSTIEILEKIDNGYRLPPPPGCPRAFYRMMIKCWHPDPRSRPQFGQITKLLAGNGNYLLGWSDEDKQVASEDGIKLGAPLECAKDLYNDLQYKYRQI
ncbi:uncharacterized protein [Dysidea avara]|uniref:uncharacterized protein isoform X2 n=1 Tax=Dysidea avara TaxID=196820 RepID=UPI00333163D6